MQDSAAARVMSCRFCAQPVDRVVVDLGMSPLANAFLRPEQLSDEEPFYPLRLQICDACLLVQLDSFESPEAIFTEYAYFSSYSSTWLAHAERFVKLAVDRFGLGAASNVVELASNDGYLLQYFQQRQIPVLGVEPAVNVAAVAAEKGIPTTVGFFGTELAERLAQRGLADLLVANNVLAHVPDLNDFAAGMKLLLAPNGAITIEVQHLMPMIEDDRFDTIYHEHFSYFTLNTLQRVLASHGLVVFDVEQLPTHGGSLRVYARHAEHDEGPPAPAVGEMLQRERAAGLTQPDGYERIASSARETKREILEKLTEWKREGKQIVGYGAAAKGNTLLNYCGVGTDVLDYMVDLNPVKQGTFLPGVRIPVKPPEALDETRPDIIFILAWNLREEVMEQLAHVREWGCRFASRAPELRVFE
jgi:hypothetical protein